MDERRADTALRRAAEEQAAQDEKERQWRIARGTATREDLAGPAVGPEPLARGAWMTELPPERRPRAAPSQANYSLPTLNYARAWFHHVHGLSDSHSIARIPHTVSSQAPLPKR